MGPVSLAERIGQPVEVAKQIMRGHRETYRTYWRWSDGVLDQSNLSRALRTPFGWTWHISDKPREAQVRNWLMQAGGSDVMRIAAIYMVRAGIKVCAPVHDAFLIEAPVENLDDVVREARRLMSKASCAVTGGLEIKTDAKVVRWPGRFNEEKGAELWEIVNSIIQGSTPPTHPTHQYKDSLFGGWGGWVGGRGGS